MKFFDWLFRRKKDQEVVNLSGYTVSVEPDNEERRLTFGIEHDVVQVENAPARKLVDYGTATAIVEPSFYSTWLNSIRSKLPTDVRWDSDITADVSLAGGRGRCKVVWRAMSERGHAYLMTMLDSLSNPQVEETKKLEGPKS